MEFPGIKVFLTVRAVIPVCAFLLALGMVGSAWAATQYDYIATTKAKRAKRQDVKAGSLTWDCLQGNQCRISGPWPIPSVSACRALTKQVGFIQRYGHAGRYLSKAELNKCNEGIMLESLIDRPADQRDAQNPTSSAKLSTTEVDAPLRERASERLRAKKSPYGTSQPTTEVPTPLPEHVSGAMRAKSPYSTSQVRPPSNQGDVQNPALTSKLREARKAQRNEDQRFLQARDRLREGHVIIDAGSITVFLR